MYKLMHSFKCLNSMKSHSILLTNKRFKSYVRSNPIVSSTKMLWHLSMSIEILKKMEAQLEEMKDFGYYKFLNGREIEV